MRPGFRQIAVPKNYYDDLRKMQERLKAERRETIPLWKCAHHVALEKERWRDDQWFFPPMKPKNRRGNLFDMFSILFIVAAVFIVMLVFILFINGFNSQVQASSLPSEAKNFIGTIQGQNSWVLDFIFAMLLISLPLVSAILAYFNNIPPFLFYASIGVLLLIVVLANIIGDAYTNITTVDSVSNITSTIPMTNWIMSHFIIYSLVSSFIIMFGVFLKPRGGGYSP